MKKWIQTCPQCGSEEIVYEAGMVTGQKYHCLSCGYIGSFVVENEVEIEEDGPSKRSSRSREHDA